MNQNSQAVHDPFPKLAELFLGSGGHLPQDSLQRLESAERTQEVRESLAQEAKDLEWHGAWKIVTERLPELFDISVLDLLLAGWEKYRLIADYAEKSRNAPGKAFHVPMHKKTLSSEHHPCIDLLINEKVVETLDFTIRLKLDFAGAELVLEDGELRGLATGECKGSGEVYLRDTRLYKKAFGKLDLPGEVRFSGGLAIPTREHPYVWGEGPARVEAVTAKAPAPKGKAGRVPLAWASLGTLLLGVLVGSQLDPSLLPSLFSGGDAEHPPQTTLPAPPAEPVPQPATPQAVPAEPVLPEPAPPEVAAPEPSPAEPAVPEPAPNGPSAAEAGAHALTVVTSPPEARVRIMNIAPVYSPGMLLPPGRYHVRVEHPGYVTQEQWIELVDQVRSVNIVLEPEPEPEPAAAAEPDGYRVVFRTVPPGATILISRDGRFEPFTSGTRLEPGNHLFSIRLDGYQPTLHYVRLGEADEEVTIQLQEDLFR